MFFGPKALLRRKPKTVMTKIEANFKKFLTKLKFHFPFFSSSDGCQIFFNLGFSPFAIINHLSFCQTLPEPLFLLLNSRDIHYKNCGLVLG
jgi:hypothetical protein